MTIELKAPKLESSTTFDAQKLYMACYAIEALCNHAPLIPGFTALDLLRWAGVPDEHLKS